MASNTTVAPATGLIADFDGTGSGQGLNTAGGISTWSAEGINKPGGPTVTTDGKALTITVDVPAKSATQYIGAFLHFDGCVDASAFAGVQFTLSGSLSGCTLQYASADDGHTSTAGGWMIASAPPGSYPMQHSIFAARLTATPQTVRASFNGGDIRGVPSAPMDASKLIFLQWQLTVPAARAGQSPPARCTGQITVDDLSFFGKAGGPVVVSAATPTRRDTTLSINYWQWRTAYGDGVTGTEALIAALKPTFLRVGGHTNDANGRDVFDLAALDQSVAYARAIGAEPIMQVPMLADATGKPPTADSAAQIVAHANVSKGYGIKYFSLGNEPDLYATQGSPDDPTQPARPGYRPADYCASAKAFAAAMKAVDPTIKLVGPDLSWRYQPGSDDTDWLTPILRGCGELFDVISIHRYPFSAEASTLALASGDATALANAVAGVRDIMRSTGYAGKPLALTEMNIAYDQTLCVLDASPGTLGSALWMADNLGTAMELGLWTAAVWGIADPDDWAFGLLDMPPTHAPRPSYWAHALYTDHFGPTLLKVTAAPFGVSAHASRNQADDATQIIAINWNATPAQVPFQVTGPAGARTATLALPPTSMTAVEIPDQGTARAWTYGEAQRLASMGPQLLTDGPTDGGTGEIDGGSAGAGRRAGKGCATDAGAGVCPTVTPSGPAITVDGKSSGTSLSFGTNVYKWTSFTWANSGQTAPTIKLAADGNGIEMAGSVVSPSNGGSDRYTGAGFYFAGPVCVDASAYTGVMFDFVGDLGGCELRFGATASNQITASEFKWGTCTSTLCYGSSAPPSAPAATIRVPFSSLTLGMPVDTLESSLLHAIQWVLGAPADSANGQTCSAHFTVSNVAFY